MIDLSPAFETYTRSLLGEEQYRLFCLALEQEPSVSFRLNGAKQGLCSVQAAAVPWCDTGFYADSRLTFTFDPLFHAGGYYVQEASSMFLEQIVKQYVQNPVCWLDLCAAPGGKSTHALSLLPQGSFVVANEPVRARAQVLAENMAKWGAENAMVVSAFPDEWHQIPALFDVILTDVPCSGEGMFRKDKQAVAEWSADNVSRCVARQREIVLRAWELLKPGGLLIYSTCTYNMHEDEEMVAWMVDTLGAEFLPVAVDPQWGVVDEMGLFRLGYRFFPHKLRGEGLFMSALRKPGSPSESFTVLSRNDCRKRSLAKQILPFHRYDWVRGFEEFDFITQPNSVVALPRAWRDLYDLLSSRFTTLYGGVMVALIKGKEWIQHPMLALSTRLNVEKFCSIDLSWNEAVVYLRCQAMRFDAPMEKGVSLIVYQNSPLGWVNCVGNRANNLYPSEWRIRSGYLPTAPKLLEDLK